MNKEQAAALISTAERDPRWVQGRRGFLAAAESLKKRHGASSGSQLLRRVGSRIDSLDADHRILIPELLYSIADGEDVLKLLGITPLDHRPRERLRNKRLRLLVEAYRAEGMTKTKACERAAKLARMTPRAVDQVLRRAPKPRQKG